MTSPAPRATDLATPLVSLTLGDSAIQVAVTSGSPLRSPASSGAAAALPIAMPHGIPTLAAAVAQFWKLDGDLRTRQQFARQRYQERVASIGAGHTNDLRMYTDQRSATLEQTSLARNVLERADLGRMTNRLVEARTPGLVPAGRAAEALAQAAGRAHAAREGIERTVADLHAWHRSKDLPRLLGGGVTVALLFWLTKHFANGDVAMLVLPILVAAAVFYLRPHPALIATNRLAGWIVGRRQRSGALVKLILWLPSLVAPLTARMADPFHRTAIRLVLYGYLFAVTAIVLSGLLAAIVYVFLMVVLGAAVLGAIANAVKDN